MLDVYNNFFAVTCNQDVTSLVSAACFNHRDCVAPLMMRVPSCLTPENHYEPLVTSVLYSCELSNQFIGSGCNPGDKPLLLQTDRNPHGYIWSEGYPARYVAQQCQWVIQVSSRFFLISFFFKISKGTYNYNIRLCYTFHDKFCFRFLFREMKMK